MKTTRANSHGEAECVLFASLPSHARQRQILPGPVCVAGSDGVHKHLIYFSGVSNAELGMVVYTYNLSTKHR